VKTFAHANKKQPRSVRKSAAQTASGQLLTIAKKVANAIAICAVVVPVLCYWLSALVFGSSRTFPGWSHLLSLLPGISGSYIRRAFYQLILPACGRDVCISFGTVFSHPTSRLGNSVYVGVGCMLGDVTLEDDVLVGSHVSIINGRRQHGTERLDIPVREQPGAYPRVVIGRDSWIGDRAIVTADVGKHCVVGAGAVVTKPVPDFAIVVGNPARVQGFRTQTEGRFSDHSSSDIPCEMVPAHGADPEPARTATIGKRREQP
jgi:acetyltransferase-like isoleucine patch superfamily enzyme